MPKRFRTRDRRSLVVSMGREGFDSRDVTEGRREEVSQREVRSGVGR